MKPINFDQVNVVLAKDQPEYQPLPVMMDNHAGVVVSCWKLTMRERLKLLFGKPLWFQMMNFGQSPMPIYPTVDVREVINIDAWNKLTDSEKAEITRPPEA